MKYFIRKLLEDKFNKNMNKESKILKIHKKNHKIYNKGHIKYSYYLSEKIEEKYNCIISPGATIGKNLNLPHCIGIVIGQDVIIGDRCTIYQNVTLGQKNNGYPIIGNNVIIYAGAVVIGKIKIGNNCVIGANAVVIHDIPDNCIVAGVPAKIIKRTDDYE